MRMTRRAGRLFTLILLCAGAAGAQEPATSPPPRQLSEKGLGTVYVYRLDRDYAVLFGRSLPVYFGERAGQKQRQIAALRKKRYFMMRLPPGTYTFDTQGMDGKLELEVAAGGEYYLRLERGEGCPSEDPDSWFIRSTCESRHPSVERVAPEHWRQHAPELEPIKAANIRDRKLVIIPTGAPSDNAVLPNANRP